MVEDQHTLSYKVMRTIREPNRIIPLVKRLIQNQKIAASSKGHLDYYGKVVSERAKLDPNLAIGSDNKDSWLSIGELQFNYLVKHGLQPQHNFLDLGCGNLRAGWRIIGYLEDAKYTGVDIAPEIIRAALTTLIDYSLSNKRPYLYLVGDTSLGFLPSNSFDIVQAHSVYSHCPIDIIRRSMLGVKRLLRAEGFFDFTFFKSSETGGNLFREDYFYRLDVILDLVKSCGFSAQVMDDWIDHPQTKIRARIV